MEQAAVRRARKLRDWTSCAPRFVANGLHRILQHSRIPEQDRERIRSWLDGLELGEPGTWMCRFPAVAGPDAPEALEGGLLSIVATDPGVLPPRASHPASGIVDLGGLVPPAELHIAGLPTREVLVIGGSGAAAAWLAHRARETGRQVPANVVVSAGLLPGPDGEPRLASVTGGGAKARVVARELPGATLFLCGDPEEAAVVPLRAGAPVRELEQRVWPAVAIVDRTELTRLGSVARSAFEAHDYAAAEPRYREVANSAGTDDVELHYEACLRLALLAIHRGHPHESDAWLDRAADLERSLPRSKRGTYAVERIGTLAGRAIDGFRPHEAREVLETKIARHAAEDPTDTWKQVQMHGAWRRLHLLTGAPARARDAQRAMVEVTADDPLECARSLIDLGFVETKCGDLGAASVAFRAARAAIPDMPPIYGLQSLAFLTWHVARYCHRGGDLDGLGDLIAPTTLDALLADTKLQPAGRWRVAAVRAATPEELETLANGMSDFQRWYLGVFLLETPATHALAGRLLAGAAIDLAGMPVLAAARDELRAGRRDPEPFLTLAAY